MRVAAFFLAVLWFGADYISKQWALGTLSEHSIHVNNVMNFALAFNRGAAFSFLAQHNGWQRWLFIGLAIVVGIWLIYAILHEPRYWANIFGYASILGGAIGNAWDRVTHGYVVDFIQWHYQNFYWPTFNLADVAITCGVVMLLLGWLIHKPTGR